MSKELEALSALRSTINLVDYQDSGQYYDKMKWLNTIEQALTQKAKQEKEISALEHLCENQEKIIERNENELSEFRSVISENFNVKDGEETPEKLNEILDDLIKTIEKQAKILDILKKKEVCIQMLKHILKLDKKDVLEYGYTEEEYDLLKEWLKND